MPVNRTEFRIIAGGIIVLLACILGFQISGSGNVPVASTTSTVVPTIKAAPTTKPTHVQTSRIEAAPVSVVPFYTGDPFNSPRTGLNAHTTVTFYSCASGLTAVDLPVGKSYVSGGTEIKISEGTDDEDNQSSVTVSITLGKTIIMPGMILHTNASIGDPTYTGPLSDTAFATRLAAGATDTHEFDTDSYTPNGGDYGDTISYFTFCMK